MELVTRQLAEILLSSRAYWSLSSGISGIVSYWKRG